MAFFAASNKQNNSGGVMAKQNEPSQKAEHPPSLRMLSIQYDDREGLKVSASPDMVSTLLQHAGIVKAPLPPVLRPAPHPAVDWTAVAKIGLSTVEHLFAALKAHQDAGR
jgi:hypothetical protein